MAPVPRGELLLLQAIARTGKNAPSPFTAANEAQMDD